MNLESDSELER
jgi:hypothetical protein